MILFRTCSCPPVYAFCSVNFLDVFFSLFGLWIATNIPYPLPMTTDKCKREKEEEEKTSQNSREILHNFCCHITFHGICYCKLTVVFFSVCDTQKVVFCFFAVILLLLLFCYYSFILDLRALWIPFAFVWN